MKILIIIFIGCLAISIINAIGAILSRRLQIQYIWFTFGSILIYSAVAFYATRLNSPIFGVLASAITGFFDATVGSFISKKLKVNIPEEYQNMEITPKLILSIIIFASIIGMLTITLMN